MREIWEFQLRLENRRGRKAAESWLTTAAFSAAYDFLLLGWAGDTGDLGSWWTEFSNSHGTAVGAGRVGKKGQGWRAPISPALQQQGMTTAFIGLRQPRQDPLRQLRQALLAIAQLPGTAITAVSSAYRSAAVGPGVQPDYLNAVLRLETSLRALDLLGTLRGIRTGPGRVRTVHLGRAQLDLDILLYGDRQLATPG